MCIPFLDYRFFGHRHASAGLAFGKLMWARIDVNVFSILIRKGAASSSPLRLFTSKYRHRTWMNRYMYIGCIPLLSAGVVSHIDKKIDKFAYLC